MKNLNTNNLNRLITPNETKHDFVSRQKLDVRSQEEINLYKTISDIIKTGLTVNPAKWTPQDAISKLFEEGGELSQAVQTKLGKLKKNLPPNADFDEAADALMCVIDVLAQANRNVPTALLITELVASVNRKLPEWKKIIAETNSV